MSLDPRDCLQKFVTTGTNRGSRLPTFRVRDLQRTVNNVVQVGENIGDRIEGGINALGRGDILSGQFLSAFDELRCPPTPYADYFGQFMPPKYPFLFFVSVKVRPDFKDVFNPHTNGEMHWFVKQIDRPNVKYEYEDINMYNFRTKALKNIMYEPITMTLYDDMKDAGHTFWNTYLRLTSPIAVGDRFKNLDLLREQGMDWDVTKLQNNQVEKPPGGYAVRLSSDRGSGSSGVLPGTGEFNSYTDHPIVQITAHHILDWGRKYIAYNYYHPKISDIKMDELDFDKSGPQQITITFSYDQLDMSYPQKLSEDFISANLPPMYPINNEDITDGVSSIIGKLPSVDSLLSDGINSVFGGSGDTSEPQNVFTPPGR